MTTVSLPTKTGRWRFFLAAIAAALVGLLGAGTASAATLPKLETRVGASTQATAYVVGVHESISAGQRWDNAPPQAETASATGVAAKTADNLLTGLPKSAPKPLGLGSTGRVEVRVVATHDLPGEGHILGEAPLLYSDRPVVGAVWVVRPQASPPQ